ncbi:CRTAC1 family protein [Synoicihabitans lomoniglobus]|uniref:CRTAC1 family protein n=1 Tax=Synoicihabitans lomoniglobus TaxID=2909285 RepID=A0AAF0I7T1_9BACT|nr:CRTAC1 family protein [Opitutaceae bacterium LMO-M01]WED66991.1 CRTAC1 family protein [Opitutaceae bacterium LMO-M01]
MKHLLPLFVLAAATSATLPNISESVGLPPLDASRLSTPDLNGDGHADLVVRLNDRSPTAPRIFLWTVDRTSPTGGRFNATADTTLPDISPRDVLTFADLNNDGHQDAIIARYLDYLQPDFVAPTDAPTRTAWLPGHGDGSFAAPVLIDAAPAATTAAIAVGDVNADGLPDLWLGNWYERYFSGYEGFSNDMLLQYSTTDDSPAFARWSLPGESAPLEPATDPGGRPTYGAAVARLDDSALPLLIELNYGRRWNRLWSLSGPAPLKKDLTADPASVEETPVRPGGALEYRRDEIVRLLRGVDIAPQAGFDGDAIRHGKHPVWLQERAKDDPRFKRDDEPPFRANGNTFDVAVGDIDNDGDFDVFVSTIIHNWAGDSSDRSRFLVNRLRETGTLTFDSPPQLSVDRVPDVVTPENRNFNQGDIFCELADFDNDGRLDLIICSSDYSDPPPHDERLRIFLQQPDGTFADHSAELGLDHIGAGQPAVLDLDGDGALDLIVGQSFNRLTAERRRDAGLANGTLSVDSPEDAKARPVVHVYHNALAGDRAGLVLRLRGDPAQHVTRDAFGAIVRASVDLDGDPTTPDVVLHRQLLGPGGHAGKRGDSLVHFGLDAASSVRDLTIIWPDADRTTSSLGDLAAGTWLVDLATGAVPQPLP